MIAPPPPLTADDCKLLKERFPDRLDAVLKSYGEALTAAQELAAAFPKLAAQEGAQRAFAELAKVRDTLTRKRFRVGFLGPFQCGKSTVMNNILGQDISAIGKTGKACTSIVTRLLVEPGRGEPELSLRYFTHESYRARRNKLCEWAGLDNKAGVSEAQLVETLKNYTPPVGGAGRPVRQKDIPYLRAFLQSYENYKGRDLVRAGENVQKVSFEDRKRLLQHDPNARDDDIPPSPYLLVAESELKFATDRVDPELELVDCPGLGSGRSVDDLLTTEYIKQLDGAFVFLRAKAMDDASVNEIFAALRARFRHNLSSRVWAIVNEMDGPERHAKVGGPGEKTTFDGIAELMRDNNIPLSQVCLACNGIYHQAATSGGTAPRDSALAVIKLTRADDEQIKGRLAAMQGLAGAYEELLRDSSISHLKRIIKEHVGPSVAQQLLGEADTTVKQALAELQSELAGAKEPANEQELHDAVQWDTELSVLLHELAGGRVNEGPDAPATLFLKLGEFSRGARDALQKKFEGVARPDALLKSLDSVLGAFRIDAKLLQATVNEQFTGLIQQAYAEVDRRLTEKGLPSVTLSKGRDLLALWQECRLRDRDGSWGVRMRPQLADEVLDKKLSEKNVSLSLDGPKYKTFMSEKIRTASQQIALAVRGQLRQRLGDIRGEVRKKLGAATPATPE